MVIVMTGGYACVCLHICVQRYSFISCMGPWCVCNWRTHTWAPCLWRLDLSVLGMETCAHGLFEGLPFPDGMSPGQLYCFCTLFPVGNAFRFHPT